MAIMIVDVTSPLNMRIADADYRAARPQEMAR